jgi:regulator of replication initiation timing
MTKDSAWVILAVAIVGPLLTYIVAARRLSGRIKNSEASDLWAESRSIREWSTGQVKELTAQIDDLEERFRKLEASHSELAIENKGLRKEKEHLERLLAAERAFNDRLRWEAERSPRRRRSDEHFTTGEDKCDSTGDSRERDGDDLTEGSS